jgi:hypothetical protein
VRKRESKETHRQQKRDRRTTRELRQREIGKKENQSETTEDRADFAKLARERDTTEAERWREVFKQGGTNRERKRCEI